MYFRSGPVIFRERVLGYQARIACAAAGLDLDVVGTPMSDSSSSSLRVPFCHHSCRFGSPVPLLSHL